MNIEQTTETNKNNNNNNNNHNNNPNNQYKYFQSMAPGSSLSGPSARAWGTTTNNNHGSCNYAPGATFSAPVSFGAPAPTAAANANGTVANNNPNNNPNGAPNGGAPNRAPNVAPAAPVVTEEKKNDMMVGPAGPGPAPAPYAPNGNGGNNDGLGNINREQPHYGGLGNGRGGGFGMYSILGVNGSRGGGGGNLNDTNNPYYYGGNYYAPSTYAPFNSQFNHNPFGFVPNRLPSNGMFGGAGRGGRGGANPNGNDYYYYNYNNNNNNSQNGASAGFNGNSSHSDTNNNENDEVAADQAGGNDEGNRGSTSDDDIYM